MYRKAIKLPYHIQQYEALSRRLIPPLLRADFASRYKKGMAGYRGEKSLEYALCYLPHDVYRIFHNLRLFDGVYHFQIDFLILSPHSIIILEVKNIAGTLTFDTQLRQLIRRLNQVTEVFDDPISQAEHLNMQLQEWLDQKLMMSIPVVDRVVIASSAHLQVTDATCRQIEKIIRKANLKEEFLRLNEHRMIRPLDAAQMAQIERTLLANHEPRMVRVFSSYSVSIEDISRGVQCPHCGDMSMRRKRQKWFCPLCGQYSSNAHVQALLDYFLIFGPRITNGQCRAFLRLDSSTIAKKVLQRLASHYEGERKTRIYFLSFKRLCGESYNERESLNQVE